MWFKSNVTIPTVTAISFCLIGATSPAYADLGDQLFKLLPDDGAKFDLFGVGVAISGTRAIIGALGDDDNGINSGSAYLFDITTGSQIQKLLPDDGAAGDRFSNSVAVSGSTAIIGAFNDDDNGDTSGSAYLFDMTTGLQIAKLLPHDGTADDEFGICVAISGTIAIVGARNDDDNGSNSGSAYLFDTTTGEQIAKLLPNDGAEFDQFGNSVAISGATAIVGARNGSGNGTDSGSAYLFDLSDPQTPVQIAKLLPDDGTTNDQFGTGVAITGTPGKGIAIVGAPLDDDNGNNSGSAYLFDTHTGLQIAKLLAVNGAAGDSFGHTLAVNRNTAIVGVRHDEDNGTNSGSAYLFDISDPANPTQITKLLPNDGAEGDLFGDFVAISGAPGNETAIVGARGNDDNGSLSGSAYLFDAATPGKCPWDLDDDGLVGASDLLALLVSWGPCKDCPADFDGNGSVGASDLLVLLVNWGPCP